MNSLFRVACFAVAASAALVGCDRLGGSTSKDLQPAKNEIPPEVRQFAARKEAQAKLLERNLNLKLAPDVWKFFNAAKEGNWPAVSRLMARCEASRNDPGATTPAFQTVIETDIACEHFARGEPKYARLFAEEIIRSIPPGSIYFGGTDPGRGLVTALCKSHEDADPFFTLTQNALADGNYLEYLRQMYGSRIYVPTAKDSQQAFKDYMADFQGRVSMTPSQVKPGEDVKYTPDGRLQIAGQVAVMQINGLLVKVIFEKNTDREFFIEESFPLDWMYPYLEPHGLIMKLNREPKESLPAEVVSADFKYWDARLQQIAGRRIKPETTAREVCDFAMKVFLTKDLSGFDGDPKFVGDDHSSKTFSKLRSSIAGLYAWRAASAKEAIEKDRMQKAAERAFLQALALCPYSPEAVFRYANLAVEIGHREDARLMVETATRLSPENDQYRALAEQLRQ